MGAAGPGARAVGDGGTASAARRPAAVLRAETIPAASLREYLPAWSALCGRALESNVFLEPGFALPLLCGGAAAGRPGMLAVWMGGAGSAPERLVGLLPVRCPRLPGGTAIGLRDPLVASGMPLLDRDCAAQAFTAMLDWLSARPARPAALILTAVPVDGPFARMLAGLPDRAVVRLHERERAALRRAGGNVLSLASAKSRKERKRQRRRLSEQGERSYVIARSPEAVSGAVESFLALERKGWKGERGTALLADDRLAAFTRAMATGMAAEGKCRIDALEMDGQAIAMGIVLTSGDRAHFWKTAFDESLAPLSPGVQFTMDLADLQLAEAEVALTDSCAVPDHPMINRLWPDRLPIADLAVAVAARRGPSFAVAVALARARRQLRAAAKAALRPFRRRPRR